MAKNGKHRPRPTGGVSLPPSNEREEFENLPKLPPPPVNVASAKKQPRLLLASRSPLSVAFRHIHPNWRAYIQFVDLAARKGDTAMGRFLHSYESLRGLDRVNTWPEQICELANVTPGELIGAVCRQIWESKAAESSMISSIAHPELLLETIRLAKRPENFKDRELCFRMMGSLPDKKGTSINIFNTAAAQAAEASLPDLASGRQRLKSFDQEIIDIDRDVETEATVPFLVKEEDVPSESH